METYNDIIEACKEENIEKIYKEYIIARNILLGGVIPRCLIKINGRHILDRQLLIARFAASDVTILYNAAADTTIVAIRPA